MEVEIGPIISHVAFCSSGPGVVCKIEKYGSAIKGPCIIDVERWCGYETVVAAHSLVLTLLEFVNL